MESGHGSPEFQQNRGSLFPVDGPPRQVAHVEIASAHNLRQPLSLKGAPLNEAVFSD
jgi:hypothetical protein